MSVLFFCASCTKPGPSGESGNKTHIDLEIVYKRNQLCYAIAEKDEDTSLYVFNAAGQPIYDMDGSSVTTASVKPGMTVSLAYDGYVLQTYPCQFSDVSEVRITGSKSNSVEFISTQISNMFPSSTPADMSRWEISFDGDAFLSAKEKRALEVVLKEKWVDTVVTVEPEKDPSDPAGVITVDVHRITDTSVTLKILVSEANGDVPFLTKDLSASLKNGIWTV